MCKQAKNDFNRLLREYHKPDKKDVVKFSDLDSCLGYTNTGWIDPQFFISESRERLSIFSNSPYKLMALSDIAKFVRRSGKVKVLIGKN